MNERFWAPTRPTITPDAVALALLTPDGTDAAGDLGASLLGMHRAGAAACEAIAKGAVPSEQRLLEALATCRLQMGGPAADAVAKSMEERYAGLLVRDLLDDAETAAAGLYRSCVTKGVAPPIAASRVGAVYGVPTRELGRYRALATDPRANPIALTDAADRTLLGYVAKVVEAEVGDVKVEFTKATASRGRGRSHVVDETDAGWDAREHPRDTTTGQFVRGGPTTAPPVKEEQPETRPPTATERLRAKLGLGESAPEVVVAPEPTTAPPAPVQRPKRVQRQQRQKRKPIRGQLQPTGVTANAGMTANAEMTANAHLFAHHNWVYFGGSLKRTNELRARLGMTRTIEEQKEASKDLVIPHGRTKNRPDDLMDLPIPTGTHGEYGEVWAPLAFVLGQGEGLDFRIHAHGTGTQDDPRRFRAGWLVEGAGQPETTEERTDGKRTEADLRLDFMAEIAKARAKDAGAGDPVVATLNPKLMGSHDWEREAYVRGLQTEMAAGSKVVEQEGGDSDDERDDAIEAEAENVELMTDLRTGIEVLVHWQPVVDPDGEIRFPHRRPQPLVEMFVLKGEAFSGRLVEGGSPGSIQDQWLIDPNQALTISEDYVPYWDSERKIVVHVYQLRPISDAEANALENTSHDDPFTKAIQDRGRLRGREAVEFEQEHPRDTEGRFAPKAEAASAVAPTAVPTPIERLRASLGLEETDVQQVTPPNRKQRRQHLQRQQRVKRRPIKTQAPTVAPSGLVASQLTSSGQMKARSQLTSRSVTTQTSMRTQSMIQSVNRVMAQRAEKLPNLPQLSDASDFLVLNKGTWGNALDVLPDELQEVLEQEGGTIPLRGLFRQRLLRDQEKRKFDHAQAQLINNATEDLFSNALDVVEKPLGDPFQYTGEDPHGNVRTMGEGEETSRSLGDRIFDEFDKHPKIDQISVYEDPSTGWVQLYGNSRPVAQQYLIELPEDVNLAWEGLELRHVKDYRTKNVTIESDGELKPLLPVDLDVEGVGALSLPVQIFRVIAPRVGYRRVGEQ